MNFKSITISNIFPVYAAASILQSTNQVQPKIGAKPTDADEKLLDLVCCNMSIYELRDSNDFQSLIPSLRREIL